MNSEGNQDNNMPTPPTSPRPLQPLPPASPTPPVAPPVATSNMIASAPVVVGPPANNALQTKKKHHRWPIVLLVIILLATVVVTLIAVFSNKKNDEVSFHKDYQYLSTDNEGTYIIKDAPEDIVFYVSEDAEYIVSDENGDKVDTEHSGYSITNSGGYKKGKKCTIALSKGNFLASQLKDTSTVEFKIRKDEVKEYTYSQNTKFLSPNEVTVTDGTIMNCGNGYDAGDVIVIGDKKTFSEAYYITAKNGALCDTRKAALNEIYSTLDVYYKQYADLSNIEYNEEIKEYIASEVKQEKWYKHLIQDVHAEPKIEIKLTPEEKGATVKITVKLKAGDKSSALGLDSHDMSFSISEKIIVEQLVDLSLTNWDISFDVTRKEKFSINFENKLLDYNQILTNKIADEIMDGIKNNASTGFDKSEKEVAIGKIIIPTAVPGLTVNLGVDLVHSLTVAMNLGYQSGNTVNFVVGFNANIMGDFNPISSFSHQDDEAEIKFSGNIEEKLGIKSAIDVSLINTIDAGLFLSGGIYNRAKLSVTTNTRDDVYSINNSIETGLYAKIGLEAKVLNFNFKYELFSKEFPLSANSWDRQYTREREGEEVEKEEWWQPRDETSENEFEYNYSNAFNTCSNANDQSDGDSIKFIYEDGKFGGIEYSYIYYIDTGIDILDQIFRILLRLLWLASSIQFHTWGNFEEYDRIVKITFSLAPDQTDQVIDGEINYDNYYSAKAAMLKKGYKCN